MTRFNIHEVKAHFSAVARRVKAGETIILCERNKPFAEIRPMAGVAPQRAKRRLGQLPGACAVPSDFNSPDPALENDFHDGPVFPAAAAQLPKPDQP